MEGTKRFAIAYKGLKNGLHDFDFEIDGGLFAAWENSEIRDGDCHARVRVERCETMLLLDIRIEGSVVVACDRCLEDCRIPVAFEGRLPVKFSDEPHEYDGEVMWLLPGEDEIDLTQYLYESIVLSLPYQRVHPEGECDPEMLRRFRIVTDEELARVEARALAAQAAGGEWEEKLSELKERMERGADDKKK